MRHRSVATRFAATSLLAFVGLLVLPAAGQRFEACAAAEGEVRVGIVIDFGLLASEQGAPSTPTRSCGPVAEGASGLAVLQAGGHTYEMDRSELVCAIDGYPNNGECGERTSNGYRYWAYFTGDASGWTYSGIGPAGFHVRRPGVQGWHFVQGAGNPGDPPPNGPSDPNITCPPPPPPTTTASSPPTTAPAPPTLPVTSAPRVTAVAGGGTPSSPPGPLGPTGPTTPPDPTRPAGPASPSGPGGPATTNVAGAPASETTAAASSGPAGPGDPTAAPATGPTGTVGPASAGATPGGTAPDGAAAGAAATEDAAVRIDGAATGARSAGSPIGAIVLLAALAALAVSAAWRFRSRSPDRA